MLNIIVERQEKFSMDKFDFKKAIKNNIASSQEEKKKYTLNEARITRNIVANNLSLVESISLLSEEEILMEQILAEGEEILSEDFDLLNEGLWSKIKKFAANVIKKDKYSSTPEERERMEAQYQKMMEKTAQGLLKKFMDKFRKTYPEFPNMEDQNKFGEALVDLATLYDSIKHITLKPKDVQNQPISIVQKEIEDGKLDPKLANEIIGDLRAVMMKFIDYDLAPMYKQANEQMNEEEEENLLNRAQGGDSKSMQNQKSLKLPAILGLIGGLSALGGILVNMGWFSGLFQQVVDNPSVETVKEAGQVTIQTLTPQPGEGFTQMIGRIFLGDPAALDPNTTVGELLEIMEKNGVTPEKLAEISDKGKNLFLQDWENTIANADPNATLGDTLGPNGLGAGGNLGLALGKKAVIEIVKGASKAVLTKVAGAKAAGALGALGITAPAAAMTLGILGAGLASVGLVSYAMRKKAQKSSRLQKLQDLRNEMEDLEVPEVLEPVTDPEVKPKVPAADDIKMGDWVRYTNDKGQKMLVRISNRMDLNPTELQEADRPAKWGGRFQADVMINLDTGRVSFSGPYALETKDAEKAEDAFVEKTKASNPKIQRAIDKVEARKSKEGAKKPSDEEAAEQGEESEEGTEQGEKSGEESAEDAATDLVDDNASRIAQALLDDSKINPALQNNFRNYFKSQGIVIKKPEDIDKIIRIMRKVISNKTVRGKIAGIAKADQSDNKNESKNYLKKVMTESIKAYTRHENSKQLKS